MKFSYLSGIVSAYISASQANSRTFGAEARRCRPVKAFGIIYNRALRAPTLTGIRFEHGDAAMAETKHKDGKKKRSAPPARTERPMITSTTISEVAAAAGVSTATVSRFFNAPDKLKEKTARRVRDAVSHIGYVPNLLAGGLASNRTRMVAAVIPSMTQSIFASTIQALTDSLAREGYSVMLGLTGSADEHVHQQLISTIGRRPDGIILTGSTLDVADRRQLKATGISTIETWDLPADPIDLVVGLSHEAVGVAVARHALAHGRRRAFVISATGVRALARRYGFSRTMLEGGVPEPAVATFVGATTFGHGRSALASHLDSGARPDLVVCSSDWSAHGALEELQRRGIRVPDDIAVIGFGDLEFAADVNPALTTVKIDGAVIGKQAAKFLMLRAQGKRIDNPVVDIGFSLIVRASG
jgi:LacI family transcriptional regulator, gluconate utilization system Gnt-I transcriptional repressor